MLYLSTRNVKTNTMKEQKLRNRMYQEVRTTNKYLDDSYLNTLSTQAVINNIHPLKRDEYQTKYDSM